MLSCREVARIVSESMDRDLPIRRRVALRMHLALCGICRHFAADMRTLRKAIRHHTSVDIDGDAPDEPTLPDDARTRIREALARGPEA